MEMESVLWEKGLLGFNDPKILLNTLVYLLGLHFALRSGDEHRFLSRDQLRVQSDECGVYLEYTEKLSKTNRRGLKDVKVPRKICRAYKNEQCPERCVVECFQKYISLCPESVESDGPIYLHPLKIPKPHQWYGLSPMGRNALSRVVATLCKSAGFEGKYVKCLFF
jgi:hypothetical protein